MDSNNTSPERQTEWLENLAVERAKLVLSDDFTPDRQEYLGNYDAMIKAMLQRTPNPLTIAFYAYRLGNLTLLAGNRQP